MTADVLDTAGMLAAAEAETGLSDYGDDTLPARFALAADHLHSIGMNEDGQKAAATVCHWLLTSRLQFFDDRKRFPIADERIEAPLFATGEPRSGTTLLHALMSVDPHARALRFWEVMYPSPPPGLATPEDERRALADEDWRDILKRLPRWLVSHPYNDMLGDGLPECERTWAFDFRVMTPTAWWRVPMGMNVGGLPADGHAQMRLHKMMLQQCQFARPQRYWVLKGFHGPRLAALFETYPDAHIIWVHRDPVQVIASRIALVGELIEGLAGHVDWKEQAKIHLDASRAGFRSTMENPLVNDKRIHHVRYTDFVADPVGTIRGYYEYAGKAFPPETDEAMRAYLRTNRGDRYGKFRYSTDLINADIHALNEEFAPFRQRFGLDIETRA
jgi:hypothetical protein